MSFTFTAPSTTSLNAILAGITTSNKTATPAQLATIATYVKAAGRSLHDVNDANVSAYFVAFAMACADQGSSESGRTIGSPTVTTTGGSRQVAFQDFWDEARHSSAGVTKRQFCRYFARIVWAALLTDNRAPANWAKKGFTDRTRMIAFDFADGIADTAIVAQPATAPSREPTEDEWRLYNANALAMIAANEYQKVQDGSASTLGLYTRGQASNRGGQRLLLTMG